MMEYVWKYKTPVGFDDLLMSSDGEALMGLRFVNSLDEKKYCEETFEKYVPIFKETNDWLDYYFSGHPKEYLPKIKISDTTPFRREVIDCMMSIPYGKTVTYGEIASKIAEKRGIKKMSAQAVGGAVGWNPICIMIPCHRVIGSDGSLTGYGGGVENKRMLLIHERAIII